MSPIYSNSFATYSSFRFARTSSGRSEAGAPVQPKDYAEFSAEQGDDEAEFDVEQKAEAFPGPAVMMSSDELEEQVLSVDNEESKQQQEGRDFQRRRKPRPRMLDIFA